MLPILPRLLAYMGNHSERSGYFFPSLWHNFCREKLPNAHFLMMNEWDAFGEVAGTGAFPSFITDAHMERDGVPQNRVVIPIIDEQAEATYYCVCRAENKDKYRQVLDALKKID